MLRKIIRKIIAFWKIADEVGRHKAVDVIEAEVEEMQNIFGLLVLGSFVGLTCNRGDAQKVTGRLGQQVSQTDGVVNVRAHIGVQQDFGCCHAVYFWYCIQTLISPGWRLVLTTAGKRDSKSSLTHHLLSS